MLTRSSTRRMFLRAGTAGLAMPVAGAVLAQALEREPSGGREPPVWLNLDQAELDAAYDQSMWTPNMQQVVARNTANSAAVRERLGAPLRYAYGATSVEALDVFRTKQPGAPINIFLHGGAWRQALAKDFAFAAEPFVKAGANFVVPDFAWVQDAEGSLAVLADQVRRAVAWVYRNSHRFGGDRDRIFVSGHSSGGHLAGVLLTTDWHKDFGLPGDVIKGGVCASGMFDLKPVRLSARSSYIKFTDAIEQELSPQRHIDKVSAPLVIAYASLDSPEFQRQSRDFAAAVEAAGKPVRLLVARGYNHIEILETLGNPYGLLGRAVLTQMGLR